MSNKTLVGWVLLAAQWSIVIAIAILFWGPDDDRDHEPLLPPVPPDGETLDQPGPVLEPEVARAMHRAPV